MPLAAILPALGAAGSALGGSTLGTVLSLVGTAAGTALDIAGNAESQSAMNKERAQETAQQVGLQKQASADVQKNIAASTPASAQTTLNTAANQRTNAWEALNSEAAPAASALPAGSGSSAAAKEAGGAANTWENLVAGAGAKEGSYGDLANQEAIGNLNTNEDLGILNNFSAGDARLLPLEMDVASQKGQDLSGWGSIVSSLGHLTSLANEAGLFSPKPATPVPIVDPDAGVMRQQMILQNLDRYGSPTNVPGNRTLPASTFWQSIYGA